jgi:hypothetical protein
MAETTTMIARYDGDITGLAKSNAKANQIVDGFAKNTATASKSVEKTTNRIGLGFKAIGGMIRSVTPFLDDATASMVYFGTMAVDSLKNAFDAVSKFAGFLKGGLFLAVAAAAAGMGYMLGRMIAGTDATEKALKALYRVSDALKVSRESLKGYADAWEKYEAAIKKAELEYKIFGNAVKLLSARMNDTGNMMLENAARIESHEKALADDNAVLIENRRRQAELQDQIKLGDQVWGPYTERTERLYKTLEGLKTQEAELAAEQDNRRIRLNTLREEQKKLNDSYNNSSRALSDLSDLEAQTTVTPRAELTIEPEGMTRMLDFYSRLDAQTVSMQGRLMDFVASLAPTIEGIGLQFANLWTSFSQGFGDAVARAIVYGDDFGKAMKELEDEIKTFGRKISGK